MITLFLTGMGALVIPFIILDIINGGILIYPDYDDEEDVNEQDN